MSDPFNFDACFCTALTRALQQKLRAIDTGDAKAAARKFHCMTPRPAAEIEYGLALEVCEREYLLHLAGGNRQPFGGKHVGIEFAPELFLFKPCHYRARHCSNKAIQQQITPMCAIGKIARLLS